VRGKGSEPNFMSGVNNEQEREPRRGGGRPQRQRGGYSFTPLGRSHQGGGGGGGSHDDFPGVEFSIAGGVGEMVPVPTTVIFSFFLFFSFSFF